MNNNCNKIDRKSGIRLLWLIRIYNIKNKDNNSLSFNKLEEEVGYRNDINYPHRYPQATFRYFLRSLVDKEILIKCNLYRISPLYKVNKKLLKEEIINNELFKEIVKFLKNNAILYGV